MNADVDVLRWGPQRARTGPWRGDRRIAYLTPLPDAPAPSADFVRRCCDTLAARGYARVVTGALAADEQAAFLAAGFEVAQRLHLLGHDLRSLGAVRLPDGISLRDARRHHRRPVLAVDGAAFDEFWRLDDSGLTDAVDATPRARFRVALEGQDRWPIGSSPVVAYAVFGLAGPRGYVQRLAVAPGGRRRGTGAALLLDGLHWLRRAGAEQALVNTQLHNNAALALYERMGFRRLPTGLQVLTAGLGA